MSIINKQMYIIKTHRSDNMNLESKEIKIGLLGLGTVGTGVVTLIARQQEQFHHLIGCPVKITKILVQDLEKERNIEFEQQSLTLDPYDVVNDSEIDIVIEVMGGMDHTYQIIEQALRNGKHVVTANKDLMAERGPELLQLAVDHHCDLFYEASVAGGIPILRSVVEGLASDRIQKMMGIVNGTTNYMLTKMTTQGQSYEEALVEAQRLGFAEADPTSDVEGLDAARKMAILSTLGFSMQIALQNVQVKGISSISKEDIHYADQLGYVMKLIGHAVRLEEEVSISVEPTMLPKHHPLANVHNEFNAVYVYGEAVGETMFYGPGAGSLPTATAVVSDLVGVMKNMRLGVNGKSVVHPRYAKQIAPLSKQYCSMFLRVFVKDEVGVLAKVTKLFADREVSFQRIGQTILPEKLCDVVIVTHQANKESLQLVLQDLSNAEYVDRVVSYYRVEGGV